jgi:hypothetical protein
MAFRVLTRFPCLAALSLSKRFKIGLPTARLETE